MKGLLVRVGIDQTREYGNWNAPCDPETREFMYIPIREGNDVVFDQKYAKKYQNIIPELRRFAERYEKDLFEDLKFPRSLLTQNMHLDPDFEYLTYGDVGERRGSKIKDLKEGDFLAFYASLKPIKPHKQRLIYALVGLYVIEKWVYARDVPQDRWHENAHTRRKKIERSDVVVRAKPDISGRLKRYFQIGEWRNRAYRVKQELLADWGGITAKDGFIQRSGVLPHFKNPEIFLSWLKKQKIELLNRNN